MFSGGRQAKLYGPIPGQPGGAVSPRSTSLHRVALSVVQKRSNNILPSACLETPTDCCISMQLGGRRWHRPMNTRLLRSTQNQCFDRCARLRSKSGSSWTQTKRATKSAILASSQSNLFKAKSAVLFSGGFFLLHC